VVILTDGQDTHSSATEGQVMAALRAQGQAEGAAVRVFTIAIARRSSSPEPDVQALVRDLQAQRASIVRLQDKLDRFQVGMERICASLGLMRTRVAEMSASEEEAAQRELSAQARELRERTDLLAQSMAEAFETQ
jgi:hypothetical protein